MYLVCLGVVKKLLLLWKAGPLKVHLPSSVIEELSKSRLVLNFNNVSDFVRTLLD